MNWRLTRLTGQTQVQVSDACGNMLLRTTAECSIWSCISMRSVRKGDQLCLYRSIKGWTAQLTGENGRDVTDHMPQEVWEEMHTQAVAGAALLDGRLPKVEHKLII